nr:hypothetical protein [Streptomyces cupreus]
MAAITDEPLPDGADDAYLAEHRSASADIAALRAQLDIIGRTLGGDPPKPAPAPVPVRACVTSPAGRATSGTHSPRGGTRSRVAEPPTWLRHEGAPAPCDRTHQTPRADPAGDVTQALRPVRRRAFRLALGSLAAAAAATVMVGFGWLVAQSDMGSGSADSASGSAEKAQSDSAGGVLFGSPRYLACAYLVAEGEVSSAEPVAADPELVRVSVDLSHVYKPEKPGPKKGDDLGYVIDKNTAPGLRAGDHVLFGVPEKGASPDMWVIGETAVAQERNRINGSLPESRSLNCG